MRRRFRYDPDYDEVVEVRADGNYFEEEKPRTAGVISDDIGAGVNGLRAMHRADKRHFDSKSRFRRDVKEAGLQEVGTERNFESAKSMPSKSDYLRMSKDAHEQYAGNYNGIRDQLRARERQ